MTTVSKSIQQTFINSRLGPEHRAFRTKRCWRVTSLFRVFKSSRWPCVKDVQGKVRAQTEPTPGDSPGKMERPAARTEAPTSPASVPLSPSPSLLSACCPEAVPSLCRCCGLQASLVRAPAFCQSASTTEARI